MGHLLRTAGTHPHRARRYAARPRLRTKITWPGGARFWGTQGGAQKGSDNSGMDPNDGACRLGELHGLEAQFYAAISDASPAFDMSCETPADGGVPQYASHNSLALIDSRVPVRVLRHRSAPPQKFSLPSTDRRRWHVPCARSDHAEERFGVQQSSNLNVPPFAGSSF
jgi:hypothetical protein